MSEIKWTKVYSGKVESVIQSYIDPFGIRQYEIYFKGQKKMYYQVSQKQSMLIAPGNIIRFTGHWVEPKLYFVIDEVLDSNPYSESQLFDLYYEEEQRRKYTK